jgi:hypothetical protein
MAGFREFVTGEVLTAANVDDFLMKQSVQKYADAAARDAALGTAVADGNALREGMVAYLDDTDEVIKYDGTDWSSVAPAIAGIGSNVVQTVKDNVFSTSSSSYTAVTGLAVTITPTTDTSKVLIIAQVSHDADAKATRLRLMRGATAVAQPSGGVNPATSTIASPDELDLMNNTISFLDSPGVDTAVTYSIEIATSAGTVFVNRHSAIASFTAVSTITAIEVAV